MSTDTASVVVTRHGGSEVLELQQRALPDPGPGQLLVQVAAAGVNFIDVYQREGVYPTRPSYVQGQEGAGTVLAAGPDCAAAPGDQVAWTGVPGAQATAALVPDAAAVPVPDGLDPALACAAMLQGMTAHYLVTSTYAVLAGDTALVHAAAGGVGQLLVQLVRARGGAVVATVGSAAKEAVVRDLGAEHVIRYDLTATPDELAARVVEAAGGRVAVAYDGVGRSTFEASLQSLRRRGMLVLFGASSGQVPPFDLQRLNPAGSLFVTRPTLADYIASREDLLWRSGEVLEAVRSGRLRVAVGGRYPLGEAARAYEDLQARRTTGKLLLVP